MTHSEMQPLAHLLQMLARSATGTAFERAVEQAEAAGTPADLIDSIRQVSIQQQIATRRESLRRLLYDTATEMTAIRDVESILKAIVRRTRSLLASDMAYLSLNDHVQGETFIRMADGVVTQAYRSIRMSLGTGVLGRVATGSAPVQTVDYLSDTSISRIPDIDTAVAAEGVKSIMGVPLVVNSRVIGALLVANRYEHMFSPEDVSLVESMGSHAAVALQNARIFSELTDELAAARAELIESRATGARQEAAVALTTRCLTDLADGGELPDLLRTLNEVLGAEIAVADHREHLLAGSDDLFRLWRSSTSAKGAVTARPIMVRDEQIGTLLTTAGPTVTGPVLDRAAAFIAISITHKHSLTNAQLHHESELIDDLLGKDLRVTAEIEQRLERHDLRPDQQMSVLVVDFGAGGRLRGLFELRRMYVSQALVSAHADHVCVITTQPDARDRAETMRQRLLELGLHTTVGVSEPATDVTRLRQAHHEAHLIVDALHRLGRQDVVADRAGLGGVGLLLGVTDAELSDEIVQRALGPVLEYDSSRGTALVSTLAVFVDENLASAETAPRLGVHPNTLRQRLNRVDALLGSSWRTPGCLTELYLALRIAQLRGLAESPH